MGLPVVPILTAVAPIVLGALDLYRRRTEAQDLGFTAEGGATVPRAPLQQRIAALENADLEQARLLSDLSKQMESLARVVEAQMQESRQREQRLRQWLQVTTGLAAAAFVAALWAWVR